jgi:sugar O-acyltransferase (sialic acid O-acetyltransferase NeuD family)
MSEPKSILIVGGSAGAKIATNIFKKTHPYHILYYVECFADEIQVNRLYSKVEKSLDYIKKNNVEYFIATGDNSLRKKHYELIKDYTKKEPINCIHPSAVVEAKRLGHGNLVCPNAVVHVDASIGNCTIINTGSVVEHDCWVGDFTQISPNATLCGYVQIGENCFISAGSTIIPKIVVGDNSIVAAGSVVTEDVPPNVMVAGVPAKVKKNIQ